MYYYSGCGSCSEAHRGRGVCWNSMETPQFWQTQAFNTSLASSPGVTTVAFTNLISSDLREELIRYPPPPSFRSRTVSSARVSSKSPASLHDFLTETRSFWIPLFIQNLYAIYYSLFDFETLLYGARLCTWAE